MPNPRRLLAWAMLLVPTLSSRAALPDGVVLTPQFGTNAENKLTRPVWFGELPGQKGVFVALEQGYDDSARIRVFEQADGKWKMGTFLSLATHMGQEEMGLLGIAFHPKFAENRKYYLNYIPPKQGFADTTRIEERTADATGRKDSGAPPRRILTVAQPKPNHKGGTLNFGSDGYLYIGMGDGADWSHAQDRKNPLAAILRIDVDHPAGGLAYSIPSDNPFATASDSTRKEIWAYGLRNPWKWSFDPLNGDLWVGDVGETKVEEVDLVRKGENMGWAVTEGNTCVTAGCTTTGMVPPVVDFPRDSAQCIIGGFVFRGNAGSPFYGAYIFGDHLTKRVYALTQKDRKLTEIRRIALSPANISSFGTDSEGNLYLVGYSNGIIYLLDHAQLKPSATLAPRLRSRAAPGGPAERFSLDGRRLPDRSVPRGLHLVREGASGPARLDVAP